VGTSLALTGGGTDFSRFNFALDPVTLSGWTELVPLSASGAGLYAPDPPARP
jgi:hypothetical protein